MRRICILGSLMFAVALPVVGGAGKPSRGLRYEEGLRQPEPVSPRPEYDPGPLRPVRLEFASTIRVVSSYFGKSASGEPLPASGALATGDFNRDGIEDLAIGRGTAQSGQISLHLGNLDAVWPYSAETREARLRGDLIPPFQGRAGLSEVPEAVDFLAAGDFDNDGRPDLISAARGGTTLFLFSGDGEGGFAPALQRGVPGRLTGLIGGEINRADGLADLIVAVSTPEHARVLVFEGSQGAWTSTPEEFELAAPAEGLALGRLDAEPGIDLAVASGEELLLIQGRDRGLSVGSVQAPSAVTFRLALPYRAVALSAGSFRAPSRADLALLDEEGTVHLVSWPLPDSPTAGLEKVRAARTGEPAELREIGSFARGSFEARPFLRSVRLLDREDLLIGDGERTDLLRWQVENEQPEPFSDLSARNPEEDQPSGSGRWLAVATEIPAAGDLAGALAMRLGRDGLGDLVTVTRGASGVDIRLQQEGLVLVVDTTADSGPGSLRQAILDSNTLAGPNTIEFAIPGPGPHTISPLTTLPSIFEVVTIDGYSQPGSVPNSNPSPLGLNAAPMIELDGSQLTFDQVGLRFQGVNSVLRGLVMNRFLDAVQFFADGNLIEGNFLGTDTSGAAASPNSRALTFVLSSNNTTGGTAPAARNLVSANTTEAVIGFGGANNRVEGNLIGTDVTGEIAMANQLGVIFLDGSESNIIGGAQAGAGNVVSANNGRGIRLDGGSEHLVQGNRVGTNGAGSAVLGNGIDGITLNLADFSTVGGTAAGAGNLSSGNTAQAGILILGGVGRNLVQGNLLGTDFTGAMALPNFLGIYVFDSPGNVIGGVVPEAANTISGNDLGVFVTRPGSVGNVLRGNYIGTAAKAVSPLPNQETGIVLANAASQTQIGGVGAGEGNLIAFNGFEGISLDRFEGFPDPGPGNYILGNSIFSNGFLGIDLLGGTEGITLNDLDDTDEGPNRLQNFPRIDRLTHLDGASRLEVSLQSTPLTEFFLEFFSNPECDASGYGEGKDLLAQALASTDESGQIAFAFDLPAIIDFVTATATDPEGNTSEFSRCASEGEERADLVLALIDPPQGATAGEGVSYLLEVLNNGPAEAQEVFLDLLLPEEFTLIGSTGCLEDPAGAPTCSLGSLAPGGSVQAFFDFGVSVLGDGSVNFETSVGSTTAEAEPGDETVRVPLRIQGIPLADLEMEKIAVQEEVLSGLELTYLLIVTNLGPDTATDVTVTDVLPEGFSFIEGAGCSDLIGTVTCTLGDLSLSEQLVVELTVSVDSRLSGAITNQATVSAVEVDPYPEDNLSEVDVTVILRGDLNGDLLLDGSDVADLLQELNDGDGEGAEDVGSGDFPGTSDFDVDRNGLIDLDDLVLLASLLLDKPLDAFDSGEQFLLGVPAAAGSVLDFPRLTFATGKITGVAIVNPTPQQAEVDLVAYDQNGQVLAQTQRTIPSGQQLAELTFEIFGNLDPATVGWFRASSPVQGLTGFFLDLDGSLKELDGADLPARALRIVFNKIQIGDGFSTELNLVNTGDQTTTVSLSLIGGPSPIRKEVKLPPLGLARLDAFTFFGDQGMTDLTNLPAASYVLAEAGQPLAGFETVTSEAGDFEGLNARSALNFLNTIYIPQMVVLNPYESSIGLVNYSHKPVVVTMTAHQADGKLFIPQSGQNPVTRVLGPEASLLEDVATLFGFEGDTALQGWLEIVSTEQAVNGYFSYRLPAFGASAAVAAESQPRRTAVFSHLATIPGFFTGVALLNPASIPANYTILAVSPDGEILGSFQGVLNPRQRFTGLVDDLIPTAAGQNGGFVFIRSTTQIFSTVLFGTGDIKVLANVPPQPVPPAFSPDSGIPVARVTPSFSTVQPGAQIQYAAQNLPGMAEWRVNGEPGGNPAVGTITASGLYTAPGQQPEDLPVTITAETATVAASGSVDVLTLETVRRNLGVVQSMSYIESLGRLFSAELNTIGGASASFRPGGLPDSQIYGSTSSERTLLVNFPGEDLRKLLPFRASSGKEYLLASAAVSGRILRIDPVTGTYSAVAQNLDRPDTMVLDPSTGSLLVATPTEIVEISRAALEGGIPPAAGKKSGSPLVSPFGALSGLAGVTGIAVDECTGSLYLAQGAQNRILSLSPEGDLVEILPRRDGTGAPIDDLQAPNELLLTYRANVNCPDSVNLLFIEGGADRISLYVPSQDLLISPWVEVPAPSDLILLPASSADPSATVLIEQDTGPGGGASEVVAVDVSDIFEDGAENPSLSQPAGSSTTPPGPDLEVSVASVAAGNVAVIDVYFRPGADPATMLILTVDYDEDSLSLANGSLAESLAAQLPEGVRLIAFHDPGSSDRELGFLIVDPTSPFQTLPEGSLLRLSFRVDPAATGVSDIRITSPGPQLVGVSGQLIGLNEAVSGGVAVKP